MKKYSDEEIGEKVNQTTPKFEMIEVKRLAKENRFDYLLIESTGISEPVPVAQTLSFVDEDNGIDLALFSYVDTMVTVVDSFNFFKDFGSPETLMDRELTDMEGDHRPIVNLLTVQIEFANVIILNKTDLVTSEHLGVLKTAIHKLNPAARIIDTSFSKVAPNEILNTGLFNFEEAEQSAGWIEELNNETRSIKLKISGNSGRNKYDSSTTKTTIIFAKNNNKMDKNEFEVIIIGGSYAGLSAALTLGRSLRKTLIIDAGKPCNWQTPHSHNFLTQDGSTPKSISEIAKSQITKYDTVTFYDGHAANGKRINKGFEITTSNGGVFTSQKLVFAAGVKDLMPDIKGFSECWGISVVHCPYCHGYEIRNKNTAIIANGEWAFHLASLVNNLTKEITILTSGAKDFEESQLEKCKQYNIPVIEKEISAIEHQNGQLDKIVFKDGSTENFECAYASIPFEQNSDIPKELGCTLTENGHIEVNFMQKTTEEGIFACGDNSSMMRSVATAVYGGNIAGAIINNELTQENF